MKLRRFNLTWCCLIIAALVSSSCGQENKNWAPTDKEIEASIRKLGVNRNEEVQESSGLAASSLDGRFWTHNDSGNVPELFLMKSDGHLSARVRLKAKNIDWEAMAGVTLGKQRWIALADVGDNVLRRARYQVHLLPEPNPVQPTDSGGMRSYEFVFGSEGTDDDDLRFFYERQKQVTWAAGSRPANCEAMGIDPLTNKIWFVEKIYVTSQQESKPGVFVLELPEGAFDIKSNGNSAKKKSDEPLVAKRVADFPVKNVTGMAFSSDGKKLIIRNYLNAHLYQRKRDKTWLETIKTSRPLRVVLPLQAQGEAICFTSDSRSVIVTSERKSQPIWQVELKAYLDAKRETR